MGIKTPFDGATPSRFSTALDGLSGTVELLLFGAIPERPVDMKGRAPLQALQLLLLTAGDEDLPPWMC